jgi:hypothetical protein
MKQLAKKKQSASRALHILSFFFLVTLLAYLLTLMMETVFSFETSVDSYWTA